MTQATVRIASTTEERIVKAQFERVGASLTKDPMEYVTRKLEDMPVLILEGEYHNGTGYLDPIANLELPGMVNTRYLAWDAGKHRRVVIQKGHNGNNIVVFDRNSMDDLPTSSVVVVNAGSAYSGFVATGSLDKFEVIDRLDTVSKVERMLNRLNVQGL